MNTISRPKVALSMGDPAGIGAEVIARAWVEGAAHETSRPVLIGSVAVMERALIDTKLRAKVRRVSDFDDLSDDPGIIDVFDSGALADVDLPFAKDTHHGGEASARWLAEADELAREGVFDATIMGPISSGSLKMVGQLHKVVSPTPGKSYLILVSGPLRVAHLTDHIAISEISAHLSSSLIEDTIAQLSSAMSKWGVADARIAVAGFNPHAEGEEERQAIQPGVEQARSKGINVVGPISPDSVFRQCVEEVYDIVLAMYHDQGHIAVKTWGFSGNSVIILGPPYLHLSVAHGTAYDIVGKGTADHTMMANTMVMAGNLAAGKGFAQSPN